MTDESQKDGDKPIEKKVKEFMQMFSQGASFTQELLEENVNLRKRMVLLEEQAKDGSSGSAADDDAFQKLKQQYDRLKETYDNMMGELSTIEEENHDFARRYVEIEEENNNLANLYIASFQLHSTLNFQEVVQIIMEIVINLIGAEAFAVLVYDEERKAFRPAASEGMEKIKLTDVPEESSVGQQILNGDVVINERLLHMDNTGLGDPLVVVPLNLKEEKVGAILIYTLLQQKQSFAPVDRELFSLLAGHAATAIFSSRLYMESERKLSTMQGFINLLTK